MSELDQEPEGRQMGKRHKEEGKIQKWTPRERKGKVMVGQVWSTRYLEDTHQCPIRDVGVPMACQ